MIESNNNFYIPGFYCYYKVNRELVSLMKEFPFAFTANIGAVYGSFPGSIWDGGRSPDVSMTATRAEMEEIVSTFNSVGVPIRYTFANSQLTEEHLKDEYCRMAMDVADNGMNEVVVNSPLLEEEIRKCWPSYRIVSSITKCLFTAEEVNREIDSGKYSLVVLMQEYNGDVDFLTKLNDISKLELLVNEYCIPNCPYKKIHYELISKANIARQKITFYECPILCRNTNFYENLSSPTSIPIGQIDVYSKMGIRNFKIAGRKQSLYDTIEALVYYLVKPEYQNIIRLKLLKSLYVLPMCDRENDDKNFKYEELLKEGMRDGK